MAKGKTNAMRLLDAGGIAYNVYKYDNKDGEIDGVSVAGKIEKATGNVFKTLVTQGAAGLYVFVVPVEEELDLKKAARAAGEKKIEMIPVKDLQKQTGYIRRGCSPIGMKKLYPTFIDASALHLDFMIVSAGKIGAQIELAPMDLKTIVNATICEVVKKL
ncbi:MULTISPECIES: Cys-tRNA(Pro) deacylase [Bacillaceae]|uniref:Cys-tRNA(Pro)/Cys-tRNA(Cys) deacylase n=1 Tax=Domibacillus aminovorans TaxID=29332 RepID=A0A177KN12_9BACI|nr:MULTISPECIES: Cys-tRNA(Pro) deacylase [Bacillaceae]OAH54376.1 aminoacyl-tRNA deacylase [Domibacillus aminovorans]